jgi:hypothetical protein
MRRLLASLLSLAALVIPATSWEASTSSNLAITVTAGQAITAVGLSNSSFTGGATSATVVGAISVTMSPASPAFSGSLSLSGANASSFQIVGSNLETNGTLAAGTYSINIVATKAGASGSPFTQAATITGTDAPTTTGVQSPGPSQALFNNPPYTCTTNYYVSPSGTGNGSSSGTPASLSTALSQPFSAGTCVNLAAGTYSFTGIAFSHGGNLAGPTGYVVWRCSTLGLSFSNGSLQGEGGANTCRFQANGAENDLTSQQAPYLIFDGIEFDGNSNGDTAGDCLDGGPGGNSGNNTGNGTTTYHHIWLINSDVHNCGQSGVQWNGTDFLWVVHSVVHDNSWCSANVSPCSGSNGVYGSGISYYDEVGFGSGSYTRTGTIGSSTFLQDNYWCATTPASVCFEYIVVYNVLYHNYNSQTGSSNSDGEGLIFDDPNHNQNSCPGTGTCPTNGPWLAMGNITEDNGGQGIEQEDVSGSPMWFVNNTAYNNSWDTHNIGTYRGGLYNYGCASSGGTCYTFNNISIAALGSGILTDNSPFLCQNSSSAPIIYNNNISSPAGDNNIGSPCTYPTTGTNNNADTNTAPISGLSPSTPVNNFALTSGSQAIGVGQAFTLWQQTGAIDAGACVYSAPGPVTHCP